MPERHVLYQYPTCPFCLRVRRYLDGAGITLEMRDTLSDPAARGELLTGGGRAMVPCLKIERADATEWLYESAAIVDYLQRHYAGRSRAASAISNHPRGSNP